MGRLLASALFPGLGHILARRYLKGALLAVLFSITLQGLLLSAAWPDSFVVSWLVMLGLAGAIWLYAIISLWWRERAVRALAEAGGVDQIMLAGLKALLAGDFQAADRAFRTVLKLDDRDIEGWLYLARTCQLRGQDARAARFYATVRNLDTQGKWTWQLERLSAASPQG